MTTGSWAGLVLAAHGTRRPTGRGVVGALVHRVRCHPGAPREVRLAFVDTHVQAPGVADRLRLLAPGPVAVVPLLLSRGGHALEDLPEALAAVPGTPARLAPPLGPDPALVALLDRRLSEAGARPGDAVVVAASGTRDPRGHADLAEVARLLAERRGLHADAVVPAVAYRGSPQSSLPDAVAALRGAGASRVAVARYVLAPGVLPSQLGREAGAAGVDALAEPLGDAPEVADVVVHRLRALPPAGLGPEADAGPGTARRGVGGRRDP